jgi:hypothetical protein
MSDGLVIDPTEPEPTLPDAITMDEFDLISSKWKAFWGWLEKGANAADVGSIAYEVGKDVAGAAKTSETTPDAGTPAPTTASQCSIVVNVNTDKVTTQVKHEERAGGHTTTITVTPAVPAVDAKKPDSGTTHAPPQTTQPSPDSPSGPDALPPENTQSPSPPPADDDEELEEEHYAQPDSSQPPPQNADYWTILNDLRTMTFSDAASANAYLAARLTEAGLSVTKSDEGGPAIVEELADPARVGQRLAARGIKDSALVGQAIHEANGALTDMEKFVRSAQTSLDGAAALRASNQAGVSGEEVSLGSVFEVLTPMWATYTPSGFTPITAPAASQHASTPTQPLPARLLGLEYRGPVGIEVRVSIVTEIVTSLNPGLAPGIYVAPFVSAFDKAPSWKLIA